MNYHSDIAFILSEVARLQAGPVGSMKLELSRIPFPLVLSAGITSSDRRTLPLSKEGVDRLISIATRHRLSTHNDRRVSLDSLVAALKIEMGKFWSAADLSPSQKDASRAVSAALRVAERTCETRTYFTPMHLGFAKTPETIAIGPVSLWPKDAFYRRVKPQLRDIRKMEAALPRDQRSLAAAKSYYDGFDWVAEATIADCDPVLAGAQADRLVQHAMDFIHVILGSKGSSRMRAGGPSFSTDRRGGFTVDHAGKLGTSWSVHWPGNNLPDTWWDDLVRGGVEPILKAAGACIEARYRRIKPSPLALRLLDAATWYGEGVRDTLPASKVVKFITAIERLLVTEKDNDLAETIANRGAGLMDRPNERNFENLRTRLKKVYHLRSRIVHGTYSPKMIPGLAVGLDEADDLSSRIIVEALMFFAAGDGFNLAGVSDRRLAKIYDGVAEWVQRISSER